MTPLEGALLQKTDDAVYGAAEVPAAAASPKKSKKFIATVASICLASAVAGYQAPARVGVRLRRAHRSRRPLVAQAAVKSVRGAFAVSCMAIGCQVTKESDKHPSCRYWAAGGERKAPPATFADETYGLPK